MHINRVSIEGFRGLSTSVPLTNGLALIAGANNIGKSSVIDAIRCALLPFSDRQGDRWVSNSDFSHPETESGVQGTIEISAEIADIDTVDRGRLISVLTPAAGEGTGKITLRAELTANGRPRTRYVGGDFGQNDVESIAREAVRFVYLPALRDAEADLRPGQSNRLTTLLSAFAPEGHPDREALVQIIRDANKALAEVGVVQQSAAAVQSGLTDITGRGPFEQNAQMGFSEARYERIVGSLQAMLGGENAVHLAENGLGYNNLLYIAVILAAVQSDKTVPLTVLLIEEPEAHLHPQLQSRLLEYLESLTSKNTQVIVTTHSPQFASAADLDRVTVLTRTAKGSSAQARHLSDISATPKELAHLGRFLDVTKSALLFAEGVILVEGIAEQLLMPELAARLGMSLSERGVQVVSVDGLAFSPFAKMFSDQGLASKCAIVSDSDPEVDEEGEEIPTSATAESLQDLISEQHQVRLAQKTFEWDLAHANFETSELIVQALKTIRPIVGARVEKTTFTSPEAFADEILLRVTKFKGPFAQELASVLAEQPAAPFAIPSYIEETLKWVASA